MAKKPQSLGKRLLTSLVLVGGLALALHLHQSSGIEVTLNYDLLPLRPALGSAQPESLKLRLDAGQQQTVTLYTRLRERPWKAQQELTLPEGPCQITGTVQAGQQALPVKAQVDLKREGTYEVRLQPAGAATP